MHIEGSRNHDGLLGRLITPILLLSWNMVSVCAGFAALHLGIFLGGQQSRNESQKRTFTNFVLRMTAPAALEKCALPSRPAMRPLRLRLAGRYRDWANECRRDRESRACGLFSAHSQAMGKREAHASSRWVRSVSHNSTGQGPRAGKRLHSGTLSSQCLDRSSPSSTCLATPTQALCLIPKRAVSILTNPALACSPSACQQETSWTKTSPDP